MSDTPPPPDPNDPPTDEADLIAYLDGELEPNAEQAVESRLASDPVSRTKADAYRKTFDLLDYLPQPQPSATFASRTLTKLSPTLPSGSRSVVLPTRRRVWPEVLGWVAVVVLAGVGGFVAHSLAGGNGTPDDRIAETDLPVIQRLPLYLGVDDVDFLRALDKADLFDTPPSAAPVELPADKRIADDLPRWIGLFKVLPQPRQQQLRTLHQQLTDPTLPDRPLLLTLEGYVAWLDRLPDAERKRILDAASNRRLDAVADVAETRWRESLTEVKQVAIRRAVGEERAGLIAAYHAQEQARRHEWELAQRQWKGLNGPAPWPFDTPALAEQIDRYVKSAFGVDVTVRLPIAIKDRPRNLPAGCRLTLDETLDLWGKRDAAYQEGYWFAYGATLLRLSEKYPTLPRPKTGEPITKPDQLPAGHPGKRDGVTRGRQWIGKWPDYAIEMTRLPRPVERFPPLGPSKPEEFTEPVRKFVTDTLTDADRKRLDRFLGKWPDYPQEMLRLARERNLCVPEVMLPGEPKKWQEFYQLPTGKK